MSTFTKWYVCSILIAIIGIALVILNGVFYTKIDGYIKDEAAKQTQLRSDNYDQWGQIPGVHDALLVRSFVMYDFMNPLEVMFKEEKPKFMEVGPFTYQECQEFKNPKFNEDGSIVTYDYWEYYKKMDEKENDNTMINFANYPALGSWFQLKNVPDETLTLQALSTLVVDFENLILPNAVSSLMIWAALPDYGEAKKTVLKYLSEEQAKRLWSDMNYGISTAPTLSFWINACNLGVESGTAQALKKYFLLTQEELAQIIEALNEPLLQEIQLFNNGSSLNALLDEILCSNALNGKCTNEYIAATQWATQGITQADNPSGAESYPSVIYGNVSATGTFPELSYFYTNVFLKDIEPLNENYKDVVFTVDWAMQALKHSAYNPAAPSWLKDENVLLNVGNIKYLLGQGQLFKKSLDVTYLDNIAKRFSLTTYQQARVLYEYIYYIGQEFVQQIKQNGNKGITAIGGVASQALYLEFVAVQDNLLNLILSKLVFQTVGTSDKLLTGVTDLTDASKAAFLALPEYSVAWSPYSPLNLISMCNEVDGTYWKSVKDATAMTEEQLLQLCTVTTDGFGAALLAANNLMFQTYKCTGSIDKCSQYEIAVKQWYSSEITNTVLEGFTLSMTISDWFPNVFEVPFEISYFQSKYVVGVVKKISESQAQQLLSANNLFNANMIINALLYEKNNDKKSFTAMFFYDEFSQLTSYVRYLMVEVGLGGFAQKKSVKQILFGYEDMFVKNIHYMDPAKGGDPSVEFHFAVNPNKTDSQTVQQAMFTGLHDSLLTRTYQNILGSENIMVPEGHMFNGNDVVTTPAYNPWGVLVPVNTATDATVFHSDIHSNQNLSLLIVDTARTLAIYNTGSKELFGLDTLRYMVVPEALDINKSFNNVKYKGLINQTTVQRVPIFQSFSHFYDADPLLQSYIEVYDKDMNKQEASQYDASYLQIEPHSGVSFQAILNFQLNIELSQDDLFTRQDQYAMLPIFRMNRAGNITKSQVDDNYGSLKLGLQYQKIWWIVGVVVGIVLTLGGLAIYYFKIHKPQNMVSDDYKIV